MEEPKGVTKVGIAASWLRGNQSKREDPVLLDTQGRKGTAGGGGGRGWLLHKPIGSSQGGPGADSKTPLTKQLAQGVEDQTLPITSFPPTSRCEGPDPCRLPLWVPLLSMPITCPSHLPKHTHLNSNASGSLRLVTARATQHMEP